MKTEEAIRKQISSLKSKRKLAYAEGNLQKYRYYHSNVRALEWVISNNSLKKLIYKDIRDLENKLERIANENES